MKTVYKKYEAIIGAIIGILLCFSPFIISALTDWF